jgi:hypothetical protein
MTQLATRYPGYGWEHNAGYTTRDHVAALGELGLTPHHRRTYQRIRAILEGDQLALDLLGDGEGFGGILEPEGEGHDASLVAIPIETGRQIEAGRRIDESVDDAPELDETPEFVESRSPAA